MDNVGGMEEGYELEQQVEHPSKHICTNTYTKGRIFRTSTNWPTLAFGQEIEAGGEAVRSAEIEEEHAFNYESALCDNGS